MGSVPNSGDIMKGVGGVAQSFADPFNLTGQGGKGYLGSAIGGIKDGITGQGATDSAIASQTAGANSAMATLQPYSQAGLVGMTGLQNKNLLGDFTGDPGYQFRLAEGNKAINSAAAARGMGGSGATMKALTDYGQNTASSEYGNAYNREFGRLSTLAGIGNNAAGNIAGVQTGLGNANASAQIAQANRQSQLIGQGVGTAAMMFSDERLKTDIKEISVEEIEDFKKYAKPYLFKYLSELHGTGTWVGVMAQDLEKSKLGRTIVIENANGEKQIDINKAVSLLLAMFAGGF